MRQVVCLSLLTGLWGLGTLPNCCAEQWTTIRGRIVFSEDSPEPPLLDVTRDEDYCGPFELKNEALMVNPENRGVRNVAIFLRNRKPVPVHPSYADTANNPVALDNSKCRFVPRMQKLRTGQTWQAGSTDTISHNVAVFAQRNDPFSQIIPRGKPIEKVFAKPESRPVKVACSIHAWMRAYIIITDHPYAAVTDINGEFEIAHVPQGMRTFRFWHERPGYVKAVTHNGSKQKFKSGNWELTVTGKILNLGELEVDAAMFAEN
ncbi:MAG: hypothetical protein MK110_13950 [Fuerstiella sp.]|nr:hypothetical protein [Fuerstiella sp.]